VALSQREFNGLLDMEHSRVEHGHRSILWAESDGADRVRGCAGDVDKRDVS
jgi:hypothetical protein